MKILKILKILKLLKILKIHKKIHKNIFNERVRGLYTDLVSDIEREVDDPYDSVSIRVRVEQRRLDVGLFVRYFFVLFDVDQYR